MTNAHNLEVILERLKERGEGDIEAKSCQKSVSETVYESICAYSNTKGGLIILGINPETYEVEGIENPNSLKDQITSTSNSGYFNHLVDLDIEIVGHSSGKRVMLINVSDDLQKPLYIQSKGLQHGTFKRVNASNIKCKDTDFERMYQHKIRVKFEEQTIANSTLDDIDDEMIYYYKHLRFQKDPKASELYTDNKSDFLRALNCLDSNNKVNKLGILCFGTIQAFQKFFPMARINFITVDGKVWITSSGSRYENSISSHTSLLRQSVEIQNIIKSNIKTKFAHNGEVTSGEIEVLPREAIDESVTNAILHRDYDEGEPIYIIQFANRLEIRNPGYSLKLMDSLEEYGSKPRNPSLANIFTKIGYAETTGSGIRVIIDAMDKANLDRPTFESDEEKNYFKATFLFHHLLDPEFTNHLTKLKRYQLNNEDIKALAYIYKTGQINNRSYRALNKVDSNQATKGLKRLVEKQLLESSGSSRKNMEYVATKRFLDPLS